MVEITPAILLSFLMVLAVFGGMIWRLAAKIEVAATRDELNRQGAELLREIDRRLTDKTKESVEARVQLASKSSLTRLEADLLEVKKELWLDIKDMRQEVDKRLDKLDSKGELLSQQLTALHNYLTVTINKYMKPIGGGPP